MRKDEVRRTQEDVSDLSPARQGQHTIFKTTDSRYYALGSARTDRSENEKCYSIKETAMQLIGILKNLSP